MTDQELKSHWQDWTLFGLRWVFLIGMSLAVFITRSQLEGEVVYEDIAIAFGIGVVITLAYGVATFVPSLHSTTPWILTIGDLILAVVYTLLVKQDPILLIAVMGILTVSGLLRLGASWGVFQVIGVIVASMGTLIYLEYDATNTVDRVLEQTGDFFEPYLITLTIVVLLSFVNGLWLYVEHEQTSGKEDALNEAISARGKQLEDMRERARALSEMTQTLSGTLKFDKILDAALDIGRLSLRTTTKQRVVSIVMLFRTRDDALYIVNSRGLNHIDEHRIVRGTEGLLFDALDKGIPVIGKDAFKDPELRVFNAFQGIHSILAMPLRAHYDNYGLLIFGSSAKDAFNADHIDTLNAISVQATVALQNAVLYNNLMEEKERIIQMEEDARKALVRDLHDIPTQTISAVAMRIRIIMRLLERDPSQIPDELEQVESMALRATEEIRHVLFKLRPLALESQGLTAALGQLAEKLKTTYKQNVDVRVHPDVELYLDETKQGALFYLVEEAVNNARKYAEAKLIKIAIDRKGEELILRIADNGIGFDTNAVDSNYDERGSFGMVNMRERAELIDGTLKLRSVPGKGTTITVVIPVDGSVKSRERTTQLRSQMPDTKLAMNAMSSLNQMKNY